jgi:lipopolysaccharide biosynthesis glycosyltransferase
VNFALWPKKKIEQRLLRLQKHDHHARNTTQHNQTKFRAVAEEKVEQRLLRLKKQMTIMLVIQCSTTTP